jgi:predicted metal-dependent phosphoesterase TrpH
MLVDMHVHTAVSSPCSFIDPESMITWAERVGLDAVCVTEHDEVEGAQAAYELALRRGFKIFRGVEIYTDLGDVLVFGCLKDARSWQVPYRELLREVHAAGGIVIPAHPWRGQGGLEELLAKEGMREMLSTCDALEVINGGTSRDHNLVAAEAARRFGLPGVGGSDAHHLAQIGRALTRFERELESEEDLVREVRAGRCRALYMQEEPGLKWPASGWGGQG